MKVMLFSALFLCVTGCVLAMESDIDDKIETNDDATLDILNLADTEGRIMKVDDFIAAIDVHENFSEKQKKKLKEVLEGLSVEQYNTEIATLITRRKSSNEGSEERLSRKKKRKDPLISVLYEMVEQMKGSGEVQQKAYKQQVKTATRSTYAAILGGGFTAISVLFNILQGAGVFE